MYKLGPRPREATLLVLLAPGVSTSTRNRCHEHLEDNHDISSGALHGSRGDPDIRCSARCVDEYNTRKRLERRLTSDVSIYMKHEMALIKSLQTCIFAATTRSVPCASSNCCGENDCTRKSCFHVSRSEAVHALKCLVQESLCGEEVLPLVI